MLEEKLKKLENVEDRDDFLEEVKTGDFIEDEIMSLASCCLNHNEEPSKENILRWFDSLVYDDVDEEELEEIRQDMVEMFEGLGLC